MRESGNQTLTSQDFIRAWPLLVSVCETWIRIVQDLLTGLLNTVRNWMLLLSQWQSQDRQCEDGSLPGQEASADSTRSS